MRTDQHRDPQRRVRSIDIAYNSARDAYHEARIGVYDCFPAGHLDPALLADWQLDLIADHQWAEADLDALRQHRRRDTPAPRATEE